MFGGSLIPCGSKKGAAPQASRSMTPDERKAIPRSVRGIASLFAMKRPVTGTSPGSAPTTTIQKSHVPRAAPMPYNSTPLALLAQLDRASASGAEGRGFESHREHQTFRPGRVTPWPFFFCAPLCDLGRAALRPWTRRPAALSAVSSRTAAHDRRPHLAAPRLALGITTDRAKQRDRCASVRRG